MSSTVSDIHDIIQAWAPAATAQSYDNVGLLVGRMKQSVSRVLVALDLTPQVLDEAIETKADCIVTHHPLLFKPLKRLTDDGLESSMALRLAENGISLYAAHTNLDAARDGVSFQLARDLGVDEPEFLSTLSDSLVKLVVFCPVDAADAVREGMFAAGAGQVGNYSECSFSSAGSGTFKPGQGTDPHIGQSEGRREQVSELRIEVEVPRWHLSAVVQAMNSAHPYEEVAHDFIPLEQEYRDAGIGAVGNLSSPVTLDAFLNTIARALDNKAMRVVGNPDAIIERVAVCGGSGSDFIGLAMRSGADVYVTADITYHRYFEVLEDDGSIRMALVNAGHYETEQCTENLLVDRLTQALPGVRFTATKTRTAPVRTWVAR
jgi:dinuclear metal center YbgI/SA1388 family protein